MGEGPLRRVLGQFRLFLARCDDLGAALGRRAPEHHEIDQRIRPQPVGTVHGNARRFPERHQAGHDCIGAAVLLREHFAVMVGGNAPHVVVHGRQDRDRLLGDVDASEDPRGFGNPRQAFVNDVGIEVVEMQVNVILVLADAAAFPDLDRHRA